MKMRGIISIVSLILATAGLTAPPVTAQASDAPQVENARVEKKALAGPLAVEVKAWAATSEQPAWLGYSVPQIGRERTMCCDNYNGSWGTGCGHCRLEDRDNGMNIGSKDEPGIAKLEAPRS